MGELGLRRGVRGQGQAHHDRRPARLEPADLVGREFAPLAPDRLWVADFTYVSTWSGWCYIAFVIDAYARRILGWLVATTMTTQLVLDAVEQAIWTRRPRRPRPHGAVAHHDDGSQYMSVGLHRAARRTPGSSPRSGPSAPRTTTPWPSR